MLYADSLTMILIAKSCVFFALEYSSEDLLDRSRPCDNREDKIKLTSSPTDSFMFFYQSIHIARLLKKYGNEICLLVATYKMTRYVLPLFFLVVETNVDSKVVAAFLTEGETTENIIAALAIIKDEVQISICFTQWSIAAPKKLIRWKLFIQVNTGNDIISLELIRLIHRSIFFKKI